MEQQRGNTCDICGCVYHWEMFFHNHLRDVHGIPTKRSKRSFLLKTNKALLESYYHNVCNRPTLEEIENVAYFLDIKKETVYWWFVNQNKRKWKTPKTKLRKKQDVAGKECIDRVSHGRRKRPRQERNWGERQLDQRPDEQVWKLEMDLILECNLYIPLCRIVCDGDDEIDGWFPNILGNSHHRHMFPTPSRHVQAWVWNFLTPEIITGQLKIDLIG